MKIKTKFIISGFLLILSAFSLMLVFIFFVIAKAFLGGVEVVNQTNGNIKVTPYGQYEGTNILGPLPRFITPLLGIYSLFSTNFKIAPGERKLIWYDSDDTELKGVIILNDHGQYRVLPV